LEFFILLEIKYLGSKLLAKEGLELFK